MTYWIKKIVRNFSQNKMIIVLYMYITAYEKESFILDSALIYISTWSMKL